MIPRPSLKFMVCGSFFGVTAGVWGFAIKYILDHDDHPRSHHPHVPKVINCQKLPLEKHLSEEELNYCHHRYSFAVYTASH